MSDTVSSLAQKMRPFWLRDLGASSGAQAGGGSMIAHALNGPYHTGTLDSSQAPWAVATTRTLTAGAGLTGGGDLSADRTFTVGAGAGLTVNADDVALTTPGTLTVSSTNTAAGSHTHAITSYSNPGAAAGILATDGFGGLTLYNGYYTQGAQSAATFASGFAGTGWRADYGVTSASRASIECDDLTVRGRMRVYELLIQQIRATNGSVFVSSASKVVSVTTTQNPLWKINGDQLTFNGNNATLTCTLYAIATAAAGDTARELYHGFLYGDIIRAQEVEWDGDSFAGVMLSNLEVTAVTNLYNYQATWVSNDAPAAGYDYVRLGSTMDSTRRGSVYLTSDDSNAPFIDIVDGVRYHSEWNSAGAIKVRLGKLTGISDSNFGGALSGYGLYANNVYLSGQIVIGTQNKLWLNDSNDGALNIGGTVKASAPFRVAADGALTATNATITGAITATSGSIDGALTIGTSGGIYQGSGTFASPTTGLKLWNSGGVGLIGGYNAGNLQWFNDTNGMFYAGYNTTHSEWGVRIARDGIRLLAEATSSYSVITSSSAVRWVFNGSYDIDSTIDQTTPYTAFGSYFHSGNSIVDLGLYAFVGSDYYTTLDARLVLQASHYTGSVYHGASLVVTAARSTGDGVVWTDALRLELEKALALKAMTAPSAVTGLAQIYINTSNGDLEVIFANGTTKTLATN